VAETGSRLSAVSWIIREIMYQRVTLDSKDKWAPLDSVRGTIYRIVPADGPTERVSSTT
jgi:hypothetical protein